MTEHDSGQSPPQPPSYDDLQKTADWFAEPDPSLQSIADFANRARAGFGITLLTAAGAISGSVIAREDFYAGLAHLFRASAEEVEDKAKREVSLSTADLFFGTPAQQMREERENDDSKDDVALINQEQLTRFIHLENAFILQGPTRHNLGFFRVQLSHVSAWTLGTLD
ncbi:hypothetical protein VX037_17660 [Gordonia sp. Z-3]|uniref:hypothetical protein n=1 Tax=Gordonia sp. Z-3 TaxID=3115408 RepID=UPI002E2E56A1|nr:hypothetical protein [Gordonia sp. Z-3]MED5802857.1 hypothetical protein [Gordonia sp. Z-3]